MTANEALEGAACSSRPQRSEAGDSDCIRPLVLDVCGRYGGGQILCVKCDRARLGHDRQDAGCAVEREFGGNGTANPVQWAPDPRFIRQQLPGGASQTEEAGVDIVVHTVLDDLHLHAPALVESALQRLRPHGILMIALPARGDWETLWSTVRVWWARRCGGHAQFWSRQRLSALLESHSFKILETVKIKSLSGQGQAIVLVARKTGPSHPAHATRRIGAA